MTVKLDTVLCCFFLMSTVVSYLISVLLKPILLIRFFMLKTDCFNGVSVKMVGLSMTETGMKNGNEGHGIFEATLIWALSSIWARSLFFMSAFSSLERLASIFMLFSKWKGLFSGYCLTTVQEVPVSTRTASTEIIYLSNRINRPAFKIKKYDR